MSRKESPEINAGSMADIAFLLLIFFLVTTTMNVESGILRKIPKKDKISSTLIIHDRNILEVYINSKNKIMVDKNEISLENLTELAIDFIDNGGGLDQNKNNCDWCEGEKLATLSDHPSKAFISLKTDRNTSYKTYISTIDNINASYTHLRNKIAVKLFQQNYSSLLDDFKKSNFKDKILENKIKIVRDKYPLLLSDDELK
ncbi:ExbD/TolR family protein [Polaribacter porphyrae]|uniref:Biopolymer transporter ExbD n=1 Tax=Polaribacter porphyrae TaxID=1137780 RepID=A0A2S7WMS2_9FLAO|nr:biopolymer transporter ExbD [Polaribacter porphyrae]PQJ78915.1 hypothetical protein BTO18_06845 [Polaribacter porphyrae]